MKTNELAHKYQNETIAYRRDIHQNPEASMKEFRTTDRICEELDKLGVSYKRAEPTGVIAEIKGTKAASDKIIMLRGDIDALEIAEKTDLDFAAKNGLMHACGHDTHNAMLLGAVKVLNDMKDAFAGTVRFCFQPGEETCEGAKAMVAQGVMNGVDYAFGIHISSTLKCGYVSSLVGASHAATDRYWIKVTGKTSHGADPAHGIDAAVAGSAIVMALQTLVSREFEPTDPLVVTVGQIHSGSRFNIIPGYCEIEGTIRTYSKEIHNVIDEAVERIAKNTAAAYRCTAEVIYDKITGVCSTDKEAFDIGMKSIDKVAPGKFIMGTPTMGGEDFAYYTDCDAKCAFFSLGARWPDDSKVFSQHHESVLFDESSFETGVALYAQLAIDSLEDLNK